MKTKVSFYTKLKNKFYKKISASSLANTARIWGLRKLGFNVGEKVYLGTELMIITESGYEPKLSIGERVSIGPRVTMMLASGSNHSKLLSKYPLVVGDIIIEEDVWIGTGVIIYPNVRIGKCSIVAAGAVVTKDIAPFTVSGGVPAKQISKVEI